MSKLATNAARKSRVLNSATHAGGHFRSDGISDGEANPPRVQKKGVPQICGTPRRKEGTSVRQKYRTCRQSALPWNLQQARQLDFRFPIPREKIISLFGLNFTQFRTKCRGFPMRRSHAVHFGKNLPISRRTLIRCLISDTLTPLMVVGSRFNAGIIVS